MKVLVSAYACEPGRGSEPGAGWNWAVAAASNHDVWVLTRENGRPVIERALGHEPVLSLHFAYVDLPAWARFLKRGGLGVRLYYVAWQLLAAREARRLHRAQRFDLVHHVTFANVWLPALVCLARAPFVLGPVGGGPRVPVRLYPALGARGVLADLAVRGARRLSRLSPLTWIGWRRAAVILVQNDETYQSLPRRYRHKAFVCPHSSVTDELQAVAERDVRDRRAVCAGRLVPWKGIRLAIRAIRLLPDWELLVIGDGPESGRLHRLARREGVDGRVRFAPWLPQADLWNELARAQALVLPSLRDDSPLIAAEAQALGLPVVAFDQGGPAVLARYPGTRLRLVPLGSESACVQGLAEALATLENEPPARNRPAFGLDRVARDVDAAYLLAAAPPPASDGRVRASPGPGWTGLPRPGAPRWTVPRGPRAAAMNAVFLYQPVTLQARLGWEAARLLASLGAFRLFPRSQAPPEDLERIVGAHLPPESMLAVASSNLPGRYTALVLGRERGELRAVAKVATDEAGRRALEHEARALRSVAASLTRPLAAPQLLAQGEGFVLLDAVRWEPTARPWRLPEEVAGALGRFYRCGSPDGAVGLAHGDVAPWNLLRCGSGWVLVDWEEARSDAPPFFDLFHFLVMSHALLGRPSRAVLLHGLHGQGWVGRVIRSYAAGAGLPAADAHRSFVTFLEASGRTLDAATRDGRAELTARRALLTAMTR